MCNWWVFPKPVTYELNSCTLPYDIAQMMYVFGLLMSLQEVLSVIMNTNNTSLNHLCVVFFYYQFCQMTGSHKRITCKRAPRCCVYVRVLEDIIQGQRETREAPLSNIMNSCFYQCQNSWALHCNGLSLPVYVN